MDNRMPLSATRPTPPQRAGSGNTSHFSRPQTRPSLPSRLSNVSSASQAGNVVDLTSDGPSRVGRDHGAFLSNQDNTYNSPSVIDLDDEDGGPPAKRAKTTGSGFRAEEDGLLGERDSAHQTAPGSPLPTLPKQNASNAKATVSRRRRHGGESSARRANGIEAPSMAIRIPAPKNAADFSPWTGNHPEDVLNEAVVKAGYCDKGPGANQTECNSAKPTIWPNLSAKNNTGLSMLSFLFTSVMDKRQALGKCTAPSTFRPPPRVTVTDTKREAWLRDLANPEVPLRKQSRTIPHGIRGKLLMDQCLGKDIPLQRAVWLAKCVGANELRAFRRKGISGVAAASGESKWVREWTMHVEQFVEGVVSTCGQQDWQARMNYAVKLASSFYAEKLLDADHYLDWVVSSFAEASMERLPIWIVMTQLYWKDVVRIVRRGRKLAENLLERLHQITQAGSEVHGLLKTRLQKLIAVLAVTSRGCLVIPQTWHKYKYLLAPASTTGAESSTESTAEILAKRNERIAGPLSKTPASIKSPLLDLYAELDSVDLEVGVERLANTCVMLVPDSSALVSALLDWASSPHRQGSSRVYLAARLISNIRRQGYDTDSAILAYLGVTSSRPASQLEYVYRVVGELVRNDGFSVGRFLQWLISSGALYAGEEGQSATGLLAALPTGPLPVHIANLRQTLLGRLHETSDLQERVADSIARIEEALEKSATEPVESVALPEGSPVAVKVAVAQHLRARIPSVALHSGIEFDTFCVLRDVLESATDVPGLSQLVDAVMSSDEPALLATATDTVTMHVASFAALGQLQHLADRIIERYRALRSQQPLDRVLILALAALAKRLDDSAALTNLLAHDLAICEQQDSLAVCSPASDSMIGMHASSLDTADDIDAVFASGNVMDDQLLQRVFLRILQRASKPHPAGQGPSSKLVGWLHQLRLVSTSFNQLVSNYLRSAFKGAGDNLSPVGAITALAAAGCTDMDTIASHAKAVDSPRAAVIAMRLLLDPDTASVGLLPAERYRYNVMQRRCCRENPIVVTALLCTACVSPDFSADDPNIINLLVDYSTSSPAILRRTVLQANLSPAVFLNIGRLPRALLKRALIGNPPAEVLNARTIVQLADPLSILMCAGALEAYMTMEAPNEAGADEKVRAVLIEAIVGGSEVWPQLLEVVTQPVKKALHVWAQEQLLDAATRIDDFSDEQGVIERFKSVLDVTNGDSNDSEYVAVLSRLAERLKGVEQQLHELDLTVPGAADKVGLHNRVLSILLHICSLHLQPSTTETEAQRQVRGNLLMALCALLVHPTRQTQQAMGEYIFDLASALADSLPENVLTAVARSKHVTDPRLQAIFGNSSTATDAWLALASQVQPPGSQQQRAIAKHPSQQGHLGARAGMASQNVAGSAQQAQPQRAWPHLNTNRAPVEVKVTPFPLKRWEIMPDPTPVMGENDTSLSLGLFGARKV